MKAYHETVMKRAATALLGKGAGTISLSLAKKLERQLRRSKKTAIARRTTVPRQTRAKR